MLPRQSPGGGCRGQLIDRLRAKGNTGASIDQTVVGWCSLSEQRMRNH